MRKDVVKLADQLLKCDDNIVQDKNYLSLHSIFREEYTKDDDNLIVPIGKDQNENIYMNLKDVSGLFIAGTTGTGKSIFLDTLIVSLMLKNNPSDIEFLFLDPKKVELGEYNEITYLKKNLSKYVISDATRGIEMLKKVLRILNERLNTLVAYHCKSIESYNKIAKDKMTHLFIIIDEASDILKIDGGMDTIRNIVLSGRPIGVHLILATNTYLKELNKNRFIDIFKYCISFDLSSKEQAKYINIKGADLLLGNGQAVIKGNNSYYKYQAPFVSTEEINNVVNKLGR